ncbi:YegP family protein [Flavobacterium luminosum]|uniref:YegP family protein n=1 Tax=Flavobacterium luminosum TaxID=2949086 RepID=A0ABT0TKQ5_9FLAO|nr:YegP family protein [Flavobacterium sp. HXWNR70]MCL9808061.1 YegP family protein [Flavobacterium sp. HXWNR70]
MGVFVITKRNDDRYKFEFVSRKGKTIFTSNSYELRFECEEDIEKLKELLPEAVFMKFKTSSGKFYFRLIIDKKEMATSRKYTTQLLMQRGIDEIVRSAGTSELLDFSVNDFVFPEIEAFQD